MERYSNGWCKVYLAEFKNKSDGIIFYKIGYTSFKDALNRFRYEPEQYEAWNIRIISTIICNSIVTAKLVEKILLLYNPKNFWLNEKIKGVTEIVQLPREQYLDLLTKFRIMNEYAKETLNLKD